MAGAPLGVAQRRARLSANQEAGGSNPLTQAMRNPTRTMREPCSALAIAEPRYHHASWQSGHVAACNTAEAGSTPALASNCSWAVGQGAHPRGKRGVFGQREVQFLHGPPPPHLARRGPRVPSAIATPRELFLQYSVKAVDTTACCLYTRECYRGRGSLAACGHLLQLACPWREPAAPTRATLRGAMAPSDSPSGDVGSHGTGCQRSLSCGPDSAHTDVRIED